MISTWRSLSTPGGKGYNEILMDDSADAERLQLHAQKNFISVTENDSFTMIKGNSYTEILKDENHTVHGRSNIVVKKGVNASVGGINATSYGDATFKVVGTLTFDATADRYDITGGNHFIRPSSLYVNVRDVAKFQGPHFHAHMGDSIELMVGGSKIRIEDGTISITSGTITINGKSAVTIVGDPVKLNP